MTLTTLQEERKHDIMIQVSAFIDEHPDCFIQEVTGEKTIMRHDSALSTKKQTGQDVIVIGSHSGITNVLAGHARSLIKIEVFEI
jgi:metal-dependent hydrolase (beta-lactamase superfamily II)